MQRIVQNTFVCHITVTVDHPGSAGSHAAALLAQWCALLYDWQQRLCTLPVQCTVSTVVEQGAQMIRLHTVLVIRWVACLPASEEVAHDGGRQIGTRFTSPYSTDFCQDHNCM